MHTETKTIHIPAKQDKVFAYLADALNIPEWAVNFCSSVRKEQDGHIVTTAKGEEFYLAIAADERTGVVDMRTGPSPEAMMTWPARLVGLPDGTSLFAFTCVQFEDMADDDFAMACASVDEELEILRGEICLAR